MSRDRLPFVVLVTGARGWHHSESVWRLLDEVFAMVDRDRFAPFLRHGACQTGTDWIAQSWWNNRGAQAGVALNKVPADWDGPCSPDHINVLTGAPFCSSRHMARRRRDSGDGRRIVACRMAGPRRNQQMVSGEGELGSFLPAPRVVVGFPWPMLMDSEREGLANGRGYQALSHMGGTRDCLRRALLAGIPTLVSGGPKRPPEYLSPFQPQWS